MHHAARAMQVQVGVHGVCTQVWSVHSRWSVHASMVLPTSPCGKDLDSRLVHAVPYDSLAHTLPFTVYIPYELLVVNTRGTWIVPRSLLVVLPRITMKAIKQCERSDIAFKVPE